MRACVCQLWDVSLTSDQALTGSLFLSSTILLLKLVMNYYLQPFPFLHIERRAVVSYWQNPTPGPFVSIRWEHTTFASNPLGKNLNADSVEKKNMVSSHEPKNSCEVLVYQWSNVRHVRSRFQRSKAADQF